MARKKRTDEEAGAAAAAAAAAAPSAGNSSGTNEGFQESSSKTPAAAAKQQQRKAGEQLSHSGGSQPQRSADKSQGNLETAAGSKSAAVKQEQRSAAAAGSGGDAAAAAAAAAGAAGSTTGTTAAAGAAGGGQQQPAARREIDTTGMSSSRKKNLKKKLRKQEQRQQQAELQSALQVGDGAASLASRLKQQLHKWQQQLTDLQASSSKALASGGPTKPVSDAVERLLREMREKQQEEQGRAKQPINKRASVQHVQDRIRDAELTIQKQQKDLQRIAAQSGKAGGTPVNEDERWAAQSQLEDARRYLAHLREQLVLTQQQSDLKEFLQQAAEIRTALEAIQKQLHKAAQQTGNAADNRRSQTRDNLWKRRLQELGAAPPAGAAAAPSFITAAVLLPAAAGVVLLTAQGQPSLMLRKVERKFSVLVEKRGSSERGLTFGVVGYSQAACDDCVAFLSESNYPEVPIGFATAPNCISLEGQSIGAFIGTGGANLRRLEAEHDVLLWLEDKWITVLGLHAAVKKAVPLLKEVRVEGGDAPQPQLSCDFKQEIVQAMAFGSSGTRAKVQEVEKAEGVTVLPRPSRRAEASKTATVLIKGPDAAACKKAAEELEKAFQNMDTQVVECDRMKANRLMREALDFSKIEQHELISLMRCDAGVLVVAPVAALPAAVQEVTAAAHQLARATEKLEIKATQLRILDRSKRSEIETLSGATCRPPVHDGEKATLTFTGHPDAVHKALELAQQILEEQKEEELEVSIAAGLLFLLDKAHRALEEQHDIRIRVDVPRERLIVRGVGGCDAVTEAIKKMEEQVASSGKVAVKLDVPRDAVPLILGRQGANLRRLQSECNLDNMVIDGRPQAVYMLGSQEAVDQATAMVQEIVTNSGSGRQQNGADGMGERRPRPAGGRGGGRGGRSDVSGRGGAALRGRGSGQGAVSAKPYNASVDDESAFPSLGVCMARPGGRWQKKSPTPESSCDVAAKATSDEQVEVECVEAEGCAN